MKQASPEGSLSAWKEGIDRFCLYLSREKQATPSTLKTYALILRKAGEFFSQHPLESWEGCKEKDLKAWFASLRRVQQLSASSMALHLSVLKSFFRWYVEAVAPGLQDPCKALVPPKRPHLLPRLLNPDQIDRLLQIKPKRPIEFRDRAILETFYSCGLRISELLSLKEAALCRETGTLHLLGKGRKFRLIPIGSQAIQAIDDWLPWKPRRGPGEPIFSNRLGKPLTPRNLQKRLRIWSEKQLHFAVNPHMLRHSFASHMLSGTQDLRVVQELLGHSKLATTQRYTHLNMQYLTEIYDKTHPRQTTAAPFPNDLGHESHQKIRIQDSDRKEG